MALPRRILITGIYGQIGRALAIDLLRKDCEVSGIERLESNGFEALYATNDIPRVPKVFISEMADKSALLAILHKARPEYIVHLAANVHVGESFSEPTGVLRNNIFSTLAIMDTVKDFDPSIGLFYAASSEVFGAALPPQTEDTSFDPRSPYAISKVTGVYLTRLYRHYGLRFSNGYFYNTESVDRSPRYVLRKLTQAAPRIRLGLQTVVYIGSLETRRSWLAREDAVAAIEAIMSLSAGDDFVIAPPNSHSRSVRELAETIFELEGLPISWQVQPLSPPNGAHLSPPAEIGVTANGRIIIRTDESLVRPLDVPNLVGNSAKLSTLTGWQARVSLESLITTVLTHDRNLAEAEARKRGLIL